MGEGGLCGVAVVVVGGESCLTCQEVHCDPGQDPWEQHRQGQSVSILASRNSPLTPHLSYSHFITTAPHTDRNQLICSAVKLAPRGLARGVGSPSPGNLRLSHVSGYCARKVWIIYDTILCDEKQRARGGVS